MPVCVRNWKGDAVLVSPGNITGVGPFARSTAAACWKLVIAFIVEHRRSRNFVVLETYAELHIRDMGSLSDFICYMAEEGALEHSQTRDGPASRKPFNFFHAPKSDCKRIRTNPNNMDGADNCLWSFLSTHRRSVLYVSISAGSLLCHFPGVFGDRGNLVGMFHLASVPQS